MVFVISFIVAFMVLVYIDMMVAEYRAGRDAPMWAAPLARFYQKMGW